MIKIGVDAMGGDFAPKITVLGAMDAIKKYSDIEITLFGDEKRIKEYLIDSTRINIVHTDRVVDMGEHNPIGEIRTHKDSSLAMAMQAARDGVVDAIVSAGPTQVVVVAAHLIVKRIPEMKKVAIAPIIPSFDGRGKILLDSGANVELKAEHINDLAFYATVVAKEVLGVSNPKVGLVNIGTEEGKGREVDQEAYEILKNNKKINFGGNVEPKEAFFTDCDILVTDGFTGNIMMKSIEGTAKAFKDMLKQEIKASKKASIGYALFMKKAMKKFAKRFDASEIGGAMICGVNVPIVKAHGSSDPFAFMNAIRQARQLVEGRVVEKVISTYRSEKSE